MPWQEQIGVVLAPVERLAVPAGEVPEAAIVVERHGRNERLAQVGQLYRCELRDRATVTQRTRVTFSDVVRAHYAWDTQDNANGERSTAVASNASPARGTFDDTLTQFERDAGQIVEAYWCRKAASAVALTKKRVSTRR